MDMVWTDTDIIRTGTDNETFLWSEDEKLDCSEFLQRFYLPDRGGALVGNKSKSKVVEFFFVNAMEEDAQEILPTSDSTYEKWLTGTRNPQSTIWAALANNFDSSKLQKALINTLNETTLRLVMGSFCVALEQDDVPDRLNFSKAIVAQFKAFASGGGVAENIIPEEYKKPPDLRGFGAYIRETTKKYKYMKFPTEDEHLLEDYFVPSSIGTSSVALPNKNRGNCIADATLQKLRTYDRRGETKCVILIGACGYGKTLMLQHLFLESANQIAKTGLLPVFAELRNFSEDDQDLFLFLGNVVQELDKSFTVEKLSDLLEKGQVQILLDGLDEMDPNETSHFQRKLSEFCHHYPNNQVVISSRQCTAISGIRNFNKLYLHPLDEDQIHLLLDKLLHEIDDEKERSTAKDTVLSFLNTRTGYVKVDGFVATNPMLLTIIVRNYKMLKKLDGDKLGFYELMYDILIRGHDEDKESYGRFFISVSEEDEFTQVFREFCAKAYLDGVFEFDRLSFEKYYKLIESKQSLQNRAKFTMRAFQQDVCATACMMYEQESDIYYIDPGFQDYFFARYFYLEDTTQCKKIARGLWSRQPDSFRNLDALQMLYRISGEKVDICILYPYLDGIFKGKSDDEAFLRFLSYSFGHITYTLWNKPLIDKIMQEGPVVVEKFDFGNDANHTKNIIIELICDVLDLPNNFVIGSMEDSIQSSDNAVAFYTGAYADITFQGDPDQIPHKWIRAEKHEISELKSGTGTIRTKNGEPICFGYAYTVEPQSLIEQPELKANFIELCQAAHLDAMFTKVRKYYESIVRNQRANEYN